MESNPNANNTRGKSNTTMMAIAIVLGIIIIALIILLMQTRSNLKGLVNEKEQQKVELQQELDSLLVEHAKVKTVREGQCDPGQCR
jgi:uncharacterized membrane protein YciS (DUF1049 family)